MNRAMVFSAVLLAGGLSAAAASAASSSQQPLTRPAAVLPSVPLSQQQPHTVVPPLPTDADGYLYDARTGQFVVRRGQAVRVPGHWQSGAKGRIWVEEQWMYPIAPRQGYGR